MSVARVRADLPDPNSHLASAVEQVGLAVEPEPASEEFPLIGDSEPMRRVRSLVERFARSSCNVLIVGETGTGKECVARAIHRQSPRAGRPLACINCAALPEQLLESELFGHAKGAFTGAAGPYLGRMVLADGGTVFLDEIADMSTAAQAKILRAVEAREVFPVGGREPRRVDVRIIAATNQSLESRVHCGSFRADLYYRIKVVRVALPPLRGRREDIPGLLRFYLQHAAAELNVPPLTVDADALAHLVSYEWPGNCRELKNFAQAAYLQPHRGSIGLRDVIEVLSPSGHGAGSEDEELARIVTALEECRWNRSRAAAMLSWSRMTLYRKMARYRIVRPKS